MPGRSNRDDTSRGATIADITPTQQPPSVLDPAGVVTTRDDAQEFPRRRGRLPIPVIAPALDTAIGAKPATVEVARGQLHKPRGVVRLAHRS